MGKDKLDIHKKAEKIAPHKQNQSNAEWLIGEAKHNFVHLLQSYGAPLVFWFYAVLFVVDCLNHILKKPLNWKNLAEIVNGDTADDLAFFTYIGNLLNAIIQLPSFSWDMLEW